MDNDRPCLELLPGESPAVKVRNVESILLLSAAASNKEEEEQSTASEESLSGELTPPPPPPPPAAASRSLQIRLSLRSVGGGGLGSPSTGAGSRRGTRRQRDSAASSRYKHEEEEEEDEIVEMGKRPPKKRVKRDTSNDRVKEEEVASGVPLMVNGLPVPVNVEAPPPGVLSNLWYSHESIRHVFVLEKILGWKRREKIPVQKLKGLDRSLLRTKDEVVAGDLDNGSKMEEVFLIKWRGKSYLHCSWEKSDDVITVDASNTARGKFKRFIQSQEISLGLGWKSIIDQSLSNNSFEEDYFPPSYIEVDRIVACDETTMDMGLFAKQRGINLQADKEELVKREQQCEDDKVLERIERKISSEQPGNVSSNGETDASWDPEDYVRYAVKWKGLPSADMTWEYWKDIKLDFVDEVEDFWLRQQRPSSGLRTRAHPPLKDFKKLSKSPIFGVSEKKRPVIGYDQSEEESNGEDENLRLRNYQLEGVNWLLFNWWNHRSCILADEMGLGKTIQTLCFLEQLRKTKNTQVRGPFLIIAPLTLIAQWQSEAAAWAPDLNVIVYHGSQDARSYMIEHEFYYNEPYVTKADAAKFKKQNILKFNILLTTYEIAMKDTSVLARIHWKALIVDEAHRLKNEKARLFTELAGVPRDFCLLLTGTPIQNSTEELWSLLHFADPEKFASKADFSFRFGQLTDSVQVEELHTMLKPYLLRRVKEDVEKSLPPKEETVLEVSLTPIQKQYYKAIYERNTQFLYKGSKPSNAPSLMNVMMELRKCCNHPFLIKGAEARIFEETLMNKDTTNPSFDTLSNYQDKFIKSSGKMVLLEKLLPKLKEGGHKVLIFSQMVKVLDLIEELLRMHHYRYERLDGSTHASSRGSAVHRFHSKSYDRFVMLLSTRAGGLGLNLTAADVVIIFDSDWNPQNDLQAMARAHRIGQTRSVRIYRLLTAKTYEMHMFHSASMKLGLDRAVLAQQRQDLLEEDGGAKLNKSDKEVQAKEIDQLLKKGAYDVFRDEDDEEAKQFMECDIDDLMKNSKTVSYGKEQTSISSGLGSFNKASFVVSSDGTTNEVDLDDPDFWHKAVGLEVPVVDPSQDEETTRLLAGLETKRSRKQIEQYDPYAEMYEKERKKQEKIAQKLQEEKEEKEKVRLENKRKREEEKEHRKRAQEEARIAKMVGGNPVSGSSVSVFKTALTTTLKDTRALNFARPTVASSVSKPKGRQRKSDISRFHRAVEEKLYGQSRCFWHPDQRDRIITAVYMFGPTRLTKIREYTDLVNLPLQDIEVFIRQYIYTLGISGGAAALANIENNHFYQTFDGEDGEWVLQAVKNAVATEKMIKSGDRILRLPSVLTDESFLSHLMSGAAISSLFHVAFTSRLHYVVSTALKIANEEIDKSEMGKRGRSNDMSQMDVDVQAKYVTTEEFMVSLSKFLSSERPNEVWAKPCPWWSLKCDLALVAGTFLHGVGRYTAMLNDTSLPFQFIMNSYTENHPSDGIDCDNFRRAAMSVQNAFEEAYEASKQKSKSVLRSDVESEEPETKGSNLQVSTSTLTVPVALGTLTLASLSEEINNSIKNRTAVKGKAEAHAEVIQPLSIAEITSTVEVNLNSLTFPDSSILSRLLYWLVGALEEGIEGRKDNFGTSIATPNEVENVKLDPLLVSSRDAIKSSNLSRLFKPEALDGVVHNIDEGDYIFGCITDDWSTRPSMSKELNLGPAVPKSFSKFSILALNYADTASMKLVENLDVDSVKKPSKGLKWKPLMALGGMKSFKAGSVTVQEQYSNQRANILKLWTSIDDRKNAVKLLLNYGPIQITPATIDTYFMNSLREVCQGLNSNLMDTDTESLSPTTDLLKDFGLSHINPDDISAYFEKVLLPHCLKLCLREPNKALQETKALFYDCLSSPESSLVIPDPCRPTSKHLPEAVARAVSIVRRTQMMRCLHFIMKESATPSADFVLRFLKSKSMTSNVRGVPFWWCPWIHDLAILVGAAKYGLFAIFKKRSLQDLCLVDNFAIAVLSPPIIEQYIHQNVLKSISKQLEVLSSEEVDEWVKRKASEFPSRHTIESRLAFILSGVSNDEHNEALKIPERYRYIHLPFFEHGGII